MGIFFRTCGTSLRTGYLAGPDGGVHRMLRSIEESHRVLRSSEETHRVLRSSAESHRVLRSSEETHRVLRSITTAHLEPLHKLQGWNFIDAWFQCAEAHYLAWTHGIHHQDPSLNNLMYRGRRDGKICAVLDSDVCAVMNDWDLAIEQTHTGLQRAGTMQFMAIARLESGACQRDGHLQHLYRHDLEAFFYILAWVVCCYKDGRRLDPLPPLFETWTKGDGMWTMGNARAWTMGDGTWTMGDGTWTMGDGMWSMNDGMWTMGNARACLDSKCSFIHDQRWPHDSLPTDSWSSAMKVFAHSIRFFFAVMLGKLAGSAESQKQSQFDCFMAQIEGRALPPPKEEDKPTEIWEDFCDAVKEGLLTLSIDKRTNLKKEDLPPRLASFLPDSQMAMETPL